MRNLVFNCQASLLINKIIIIPTLIEKKVENVKLRLLMAQNVL